jgi:Arc/MetJ-type ribon-helix-helix transcriptional regulator
MKISVRLDEETLRLLKHLVRSRRLSISEVVRRGIHLIALQDPSAQEANPFARIQHLIGRVHGGPPHLSESTGARVRKMLAERKS